MSETPTGDSPNSGSHTPVTSSTAVLFRSFSNLAELRQTAPVDNGWLGLVCAYREAAELIIRAEEGARDTRFMPAAMCWRHHIASAALATGRVGSNGVTSLTRRHRARPPVRGPRRGADRSKATGHRLS